MNDRRTQTYLPDGTSLRYGYDRLSQVVSGERVNTEGTPVQDGSFRYAYDGVGNRTFSQDGAPDAMRRYSSNALNQYTAVAATGFIPHDGRADEDANVVAAATVDGRSETYVPERDGQLNEAEKEGNRRISHVRCRIEHVFGNILSKAKTAAIRCIGLARATTILTLRNLTYNFNRFIVLENMKNQMS